MRFSIVGHSTGHGVRYTELLRQRGHELAMVYADPDEQDAAESFQQRCGQVHVTTDLGELIADTPDLVLMMAKHEHRVRLGVPVLQAKLPTYFNKQMTRCLDDARVLVDAARSARTPIVAGSSWTFAPSFRKIAAMVQSGEHGLPLLGYFLGMHGTSAGGWTDDEASSGGTVFEYGIHATDPLVAVLGPGIRSVRGRVTTRTIEGIRTGDTVSIQVEFSGGALGDVQVMCSQQPCVATQPCMMVHTQRQSLVAYLDEGAVTSWRGGIVVDTVYYERIIGTIDTAEALIAMAQTGDMPLPYEHPLTTIAILDGARESSKTGDAVTG